MTIPTVEFRIPISATEPYIRMLLYFLESLKIFGGTYAKNSKCVVSVSRDVPKVDLKEKYPFFRDYNVEFRWIDEVLFKEKKYDGTGYDRFLVDSDADIVIMSDADILIANSLDSVILQSYKEQKMLGVIAFGSPFKSRTFKNHPPSFWWDKIFEQAGLVPPAYDHVHPAWGLNLNDPDYKLTPTYYNYGFLVSPKKYWEQMASTYNIEIDHVDEVVNTIFRSQIANSLSFVRHQIPTDTLSINYNFPLTLDEIRLKELNPDPFGENKPEDIRVFHYLAKGEFNKQHFKSEETLNRAITNPRLSESGKVFRNRILEIWPHIKNQLKQIRQVHGGVDKVRIFIITGGRRTGTTLLNGILCSDPRANRLGQEAQLFTRLIEGYKWGKDNFDKFGLDFLPSLSDYRDFYIGAISKLLNLVNDHASTGNLLVLKNPEMAPVINEIIELFVKVNVIVTLRDPRDQICSELEVEKRRIAGGVKALPARMNVRKLAQKFMRYNLPVLELHKQDPQSIFTIRYERLVRKPYEVILKLENYYGLQLDFDPNANWPRVTENVGFDAGFSSSPNYGGPIETSSIGRFKKDLSRGEIQVIEEECEEFMTHFRYNFHVNQ